MKKDPQAESFLNNLTIEEKASLTGGANSIDLAGLPERGIPPFHMIDGPQGVRLESGPATTALPCGMSLACSFDPENAREYGALIGRECAANGIQAILGPAFNLMRTPLNGRNFEYYGEDPVLAGETASGYIRGCQSERVAACPKHLALNNQEICRTTGDSRIDERSLQELYLRSFEIAVRTAQPWMMMSSYNKINGVYASACGHVQNDIVKDRWGFDGVMVSDWGGTHDTLGAALGGEDLEMPGSNFLGPHLARAVREGKVSESVLDDKAERILRLFRRTGILPGGRLPSGECDTKRHHELARAFAERGMVLLKNRENLLPLDKKKLKKIAVIGPSADRFHCIGTCESCGGSGAVHPAYEITLLAALKEYLSGHCEIVYEQGTSFTLDNVIPKSILATPDGAPGLKLAYFDETGKNFRTEIIGTVDLHWGNFLAAGFEPTELDDIKFTGRISGLITPDFTGKAAVSLAGSACTVTVKLDGKTVTELKDRTPYSKPSEIDVTAGRPILLEIEFSRAPGRSEFRLIWEHSDRTAFERAVKAAAEADLVIYSGGTHHGYDREAIGKGDVLTADIPDLELPNGQAELISAVSAANPNTVVVLINGSVVNVEPWIGSVGALLETWYPGMEGGRAAVRVLFGEAEPEGRLCCTWAKQLNDYACHKNGCYPGVRGEVDPHTEYKEGLFIGYRHFEKYGIEPRFPFGFGLGYSSVKLVLEKAELKESGKCRRVELIVSAENTGKRRTAAVAQIYVGRSVPRAEDPVKELKRFYKFHLDPGEKQRIVLTLDESDFAVFDAESGNFVTRPGGYLITLGYNAAEAAGQAEITL